jgi:hypothetical protein
MNTDYSLAIAFTITISYFIIKFLDSRYCRKIESSLKVIVQDTLIVLISSYIGMFIVFQVKDSVPTSVKAFTNKPPV